MPDPNDGVIRRHLDSRLVSYAISVSGEPQVMTDLAMTCSTCAAASIQAAGGLRALATACHAAAKSPVLKARMDARQFQHFSLLFDSLGEVVDDAWTTILKEAFELLVVMACAAADEPQEENMLRQWAAGLGLDTRPLAVHEDDEGDAEVVEDDTPIAKRPRVRKPRSARAAYQKERLENVVTRAVAMGVKKSRAALIDGHVYVIGETHKGHTKLVKIRGSIREAEDFCSKLNEEIRKMDVAEPEYQRVSL